MSKVSQRRLRQHALAAATVVAISMGFVVPASAAGRVDLSGLQSPGQHSFDRFIVKYRDGSSERASAASLKSALGSAAAAVPKRSGKATCAASRSAPTWSGPTASWIASKPRR